MGTAHAQCTMAANNSFRQDEMHEDSLDEEHFNKPKDFCDESDNDYSENEYDDLESDNDVHAALELAAELEEIEVESDAELDRYDAPGRFVADAVPPISVDIPGIYFFIYTYIYLFIYLFIYVLIYVFIYLFIYLYIHTFIIITYLCH